MGENAKSGGGGWDERLLFAPLNALTGRMRWVVLLGAVAVVVGWSAWLGGGLVVAWGLPDVAYYVALARGFVAYVPEPFSARQLAPLLARWIAAAGGFGVEVGFTALAYASLAWTAGVVCWLVLRTRAPRWMLPALVSVPFWPQLLVHAGLPDPLYAALLAVLLVALEREWMMAAAATMFPLMLARESTSLTLVCLLLVGWKRLRWAGCGLAVAGVVVGSLVVHRLSAGGLPNPEGMSGGLYMVGKVVANLLRSAGVDPWSNVYPELCGVPAWQMALHVGPVREVGVCALTPRQPMQVAEALLTTFGVLPVVLLQGWRRWREVWRRADVLMRFCVLYGGASMVLAPALGTWYSRLFGYGWPLLLVGAPRLLTEWDGATDEEGRGRLPRMAGGGLLGLHLAVCALGSRHVSGAELAMEAGLWAVAAALFLVQRQRSQRAAEMGGAPASAW